MNPIVANTQPAANAPAWTRRQKRRQVLRACDGCRTHRVKCDDAVPCSNCVAKGRLCTNADSGRAKTLGQANDEIERLAARVRQLEMELGNERRKQAAEAPARVSPRSCLLLSQTASSTHPISPPVESPKPEAAVVSRAWEGIELRPARSPRASWFGPSSLYYFISLMSAFISSKMHMAPMVDNMLPQSESSKKLTDSLHREPAELGLYPDLGMAGVFLTPTQEEYFMSFFWQSYHTSMYVVLDEAEFKKHYQSLWIPGANSRKPSALVDIVIALSMQSVVSAQTLDKQGIIRGDDATLAGRWHFRRGLALLACEMEGPTISTLQSHLLCSTYLCGGTFHNMVDNACGQAVRTAYQLGLHVEPSDDVSEQERQLRRRLWWAVYFLDSKIGMKLGRPFLLGSPGPTTPLLPTDSFEAATLSGSTFAPIGPDATWLSFGLQLIKLYMTARSAHTAFYELELAVPPGHTALQSPEAMEALAGTLVPHMRYLTEWAEAVPEALKTRRQNGGVAYSKDGSALEMEQYAPQWLQRQRVVLELTYHHLCICLLRPFVTSGLVALGYEAWHQARKGSILGENALECIKHAVELTKSLRQVLFSTTILDGWHEAFQWQWSAAMTIAGFMLANPHASIFSQARDALKMSVSVLDKFGESFAASASAASIIRSLCCQIEALEKRQGSTDSAPLSDHLPSPIQTVGEDAMERADEETGGLGSFGDLFNDPSFLDMAVNVDFWEDLNMLWPSTTEVLEDQNSMA